LPATLGRRQFSLYNCWRVVPAYDENASDFWTIPNIDGPKMFTTPVLVAEMIPEDANWFRLTRKGDQIVSERVCDIMMSVGRLACELVEVELVHL
jgi:hypothetical protein